MLLVGQDAVDFNRAFAQRGLHEELLRFSPLMDENMLIASGHDATQDCSSRRPTFARWWDVTRWNCSTDIWR